jgi:hypothetical protein
MLPAINQLSNRAVIEMYKESCHKVGLDQAITGKSKSPLVNESLLSQRKDFAQFSRHFLLSR